MPEDSQTDSRRPAPASADDSIATRASLLERLKDREDQASW